MDGRPDTAGTGRTWPSRKGVEVAWPTPRTHELARTTHHQRPRTPRHAIRRAAARSAPDTGIPISKAHGWADPAQHGGWVARVPTLWGVGLHPSLS